MISKVFLFLSYLLYRSPKFVSVFFAHSLAFLWFDLFRIRRKVALENIHRAFPELSDRDATKMAKASIVHAGKNLLEYTDMLFYEDSQFSDYFEFENLEHYKAALQKNKGVILLGLHLSNGDFGISALSGRGYPVYLISKRFSWKWLDDLWFGIREKQGTQFIAPRRSSFEILKALKKKATVIFVLDQFMGPPLGVKTTFFGHSTGTAFGLALFAQKTKAPVVPCHTYRRNNGRLVISFGPEVELEDQNDKKQTLQFMTQKYTDIIEQIIKKYPEQWMWIHRRWKEFRE